MIMQVLPQGPSLLLAVWTGLALLEGGESVCVPPETGSSYSASIIGSSSIGFTSTLNLTCRAPYRVHKYQWYHNGTKIYTWSSTRTTQCRSYVKSPAQLTDSGVYYCEACDTKYYDCISSSSHKVTVTAPSSVTISGNSTVGYTQTLRLTCNVSGIANRFVWYRNGFFRLSNTSSSYSKSAQPSDSGRYQCRACNWAGCTNNSGSFRVTVIVPPSSVSINGSRQVKYTYGLSLTCSASGIVDNYEWYHNSSTLTTTTYYHYYKPWAQLSDSGSYQCSACNHWAGCSPRSSRYTVTVTEPPYSVSISGRSKIQSRTSLKLTCSASGTVERYEWYHNGGRRPDTTSHYKKSSAQLSDRGNYQCKACNWAGCSTRSISYTVIVIDAPDAVNVSSIEVTNTTFDTISIQWTPPNNNFDSITDYRLYLYGSGGRVGVFNFSQPMVTLVSLQPFTTYQITISARNSVGWGGNSSERNVSTLTRDEVLASNVTYSTPREGVSTYTVELRWVVPKECLTDKLEGYRLSRWPMYTTNIETTTVNRDNVSCAWNVTAIGSETYCHEWEGFSPGSQYTVSLEIVYNYGILSTGGPTNVIITIPTLPPSQEDVGTVDLALGVVMGVLLAVLVIVVAVLVVLLICKKCRRGKTKETDTAVLYNVNKDVNDNPLETVQFKPVYGGNKYTLTDNSRYVNEDLKMSRDSHRVSVDPVTQHYASLDFKSVQTSAYASLACNRNSSTAISKYGENANNTNEYYEFPEKVVPQKKPSTQQTHEYANCNVISQQHGEGDQSSVDRKSSNKIPSTSGPGVKEVGKETTAPRKSQVFASDVTMPTKKEDIGDTYPYHLALPKKHEQREKVPPQTKPRPDTNKKQSTLPPTQESTTPKPQARPQQPNPVMTGSPLDAPLIPPKTKKRSRKTFPKQSTDTEQPPPGPNVTELRKIIEKKYSVN